MLLSIKNLSVSHGAITALRDVSLEVDQGEIVTLIGSNGAGKTTLLRTISGLLRPSGGAIVWQRDPATQTTIAAAPRSTTWQPGGDTKFLDYFGSNRTGLRIGLRADQIVRLGISHVPEGRQIFSNLSVRDNLLLGAFQRKDKREIQESLEKAYELFPVLLERKKQQAGTLSGGEQQMLAIGRALMARPRLLLLDEPSLGLAPLIVAKIFDIIRDINQSGTTVFLVEQNAHMALKIAHRGYVLQTGQVIMTDTASNLLHHPDVKRAYLGG